MYNTLMSETKKILIFKTLRYLCTTPYRLRANKASRDKKFSAIRDKKHGFSAGLTSIFV
jgi:hypothetical protein